MSEEPKQLEPGRELDELIALRMGWVKDIDKDTGAWFWVDNTGHTACNLDICINYTPPFSQDIAAAWQLVEFIHSKAYWTKLLMHYSPDQNYQFMIGDKGGDTNGWGWSPADYNAYGNTAPHAICLAFLELEIEQ